MKLLFREASHACLGEIVSVGIRLHRRVLVGTSAWGEGASDSGGWIFGRRGRQGKEFVPLLGCGGH
jgi:hypothetical protein